MQEVFFFNFNSTVRKAIARQCFFFKCIVKHVIFSIFSSNFLLLLYYSCPNFSPFTFLCPAQPHSHSQSPQRCPHPWVIHTCSLASPLSFFPPSSPTHLPFGHFQSVPCFHASESILPISLFCLLDSSYKRGHMVFFFHQLASFTYHNTLQFHPCCHKR